MATTSENPRLRAELITMKTISRLLDLAEPLLVTANEFLLSTLAWKETYSWYLETSVAERESRLKKDEPAAGPPDGHVDWFEEMKNWTPLDKL
jgi:hypothetical protein